MKKSGVYGFSESYSFKKVKLYGRAVRRKANLEEPDEEEPISPEKSQKCADTMAFFRAKLAFLRPS